MWLPDLTFSGLVSIPSVIFLSPFLSPFYPVDICVASFALPARLSPGALLACPLFDLFTVARRAADPQCTGLFSGEDGGQDAA